MSFVIPNLNKEDKRIPISSVVLSSQRVDLRDALFNASKDKGQADAVNPLVQEGQKLIPSVTRVFSKSRDMYVYLQAYQQGVENARPLVAFVTFYNGRVKAFETPPLLVKESLNNRLKTMPLKFSFLSKPFDGRYNCQVTITDPGSEGGILAGACSADTVIRRSNEMKLFRFLPGFFLFCASLFAQTPAKLSFEVASIKPSPPLQV